MVKQDLTGIDVVGSQLWDLEARVRHVKETTVALAYNTIPTQCIKTESSVAKCCKVVRFVINFQRGTQCHVCNVCVLQGRRWKC